MPVLDSSKPPPPNYYADNLSVVIQEVVRQYEDILSPRERAFAQSVLGLSTDGLRLIARLVSRTKPLIRVDSLNYVEIKDQQVALDELVSKQLVSLNEHEDVEQVLCALTIPELARLFPDCKSMQTKAKKVVSIVEDRAAESIFTLVECSVGWIRLQIELEINTFCLLFFGNSFQTLTEFVVRDLGLVRFENYSLARSARAFPTRSSLERHLELDSLSELVHECSTEVDDSFVEQVRPKLSQQERDPLLERRRSHIVNALARNLERTAAFESAIELYQSSTVPPARERLMRIYAKRQRLDKVESLRQAVLEDPLTLEESLFAKRFRRKSTSLNEVHVTRSAAPGEGVGSIEAYAIKELGSVGKAAWHLENSLPTSLFALAYWDWMFEPVPGAFVNPFQVAPLDLYWPEFFKSRADRCEDPLASPDRLKARILATAKAKRGIANQLMAWHDLSEDLLELILDVLTTQQLSDLLRVFTTDVRQFKSGFPDLTVVEGTSELEFIEVKGPGDQLRNNQRIWLDHLKEIDLKASVWMFS